MERPVGEKFRYAGCTLVVVEDKSEAWEDGCGKCVVRFGGCSSMENVVGYCGGYVRCDGKSVHFEYFGVDF